MFEYCATVFRGTGDLPTDEAFWELHSKYGGGSGLSHPMMDSETRGKCHLVWFKSERDLTPEILRSEIWGNLDIEGLERTVIEDAA